MVGWGFGVEQVTGRKTYLVGVILLASVDHAPTCTEQQAEQDVADLLWPLPRSAGFHRAPTTLEASLCKT